MKTLTLVCWAACMACLNLSGGDKDPMAASEECLDCHDDVNEVLTLTVHNRELKVSCIDCHGVTEAHLDDPDVGNIDNGKNAASMDRCLNCHESEIHQKSPGKNMHMAADVGCTGCHQIHHSKKKPVYPLLVAHQSQLCISCHQDVRVQMAKPFTHKTENNVTECTSCHDPHGGRGRHSFKMHSMEATCAECHPETRGPFAFTHVHGINGDCMTCHEAHGSSNPRQLTRASVNQVCLECHSTLPMGNLGSQPPATHNLRSIRYQNCTVCHTAVHGSSRSPVLLK